MNVVHGLDRINGDKTWVSKISGNVAYLCNSASVSTDYTHGIHLMKKIFGSRFKKIFSPQHGLFAQDQDNMIESNHFFHPYFQLPVHSLYSETRRPTKEMLEGIDHLIIDLQDIGTRVYTYLYTVALSMQACGEEGVEVVILDRPNPIGGDQVEGNVLDPSFSSFVGMFPIPMRHGLTMGEFAIMAKTYFQVVCKLTIVPLLNWKRNSYFDETGLPWVLPSPNLPSLETSMVYISTVLFEATNISEGRGTVKSLETIGYPEMEPFEWEQKLNMIFCDLELGGFVLRPLYFTPTFDKYAGKSCGGFQIHVTDRQLFRPWQVGQVLLREYKKLLADDFHWKAPPFEYESDKLPIDILNGSDQVRGWVDEYGSYDELLKLEKIGREDYLMKRQEVLLY